MLGLGPSELLVLAVIVAAIALVHRLVEIALRLGSEGDIE